jgi:hypothetical protein
MRWGKAHKMSIWSPSLAHRRVRRRQVAGPVLAGAAEVTTRPFVAVESVLTLLGKSV